MINEDEYEKFIQRAAERVHAHTQDENHEDSKFLGRFEEAQSTSEVVDLASIHSKVEVALQGLAEGSSASSCDAKSCLIAFTNSEASMRSAPAFLQAEIYSALAMIELNENKASLESVESLVNAAEQISAEAKKEGIGAPQGSFPASQLALSLKLRFVRNEHNILFEDHAKCIFEYEEGKAKSFELSLERYYFCSSIRLGEHATRSIYSNQKATSMGKRT